MVARGPNIDNFTFKVKLVASFYRIWPLHSLASKSNRAGCQRQCLEQQPHRHARRKPAARDQAAKDTLFGEIGIEVKRLGIKLPREIHHLLLMNEKASASESQSDTEIIQVPGGFVPCIGEMTFIGSPVRRCP